MTIRNETTAPTILSTAKTACSTLSLNAPVVKLRTVPYTAKAKIIHGTAAGIPSRTIVTMWSKGMERLS